MHASRACAGSLISAGIPIPHTARAGRFDLVVAEGFEVELVRLAHEPRKCLRWLASVGEFVGDEGDTVCINRYGASAPAGTILGGFGFTADRVADIMKRVGLRPEQADRYPHEFSGGQRQRIGIARALILRPKLVICDEPVSALDVSIRAQIINLLLELKESLGLSYIMISHDLGVVEHMSDRVAVMYLGRIVETGGWREIFEKPAHPYTRALIAAIPDPFAPQVLSGEKARGEIPSPLDPPKGCAFHPRCPIAEDKCRAAPGPLSHGNGHRRANDANTRRKTCPIETFSDPERLVCRARSAQTREDELPKPMA